MFPIEREVHMLFSKEGSVPFEDWYLSLECQDHRVAADARLCRIFDRNFADHKEVAEQVYELSIPREPELRIFYGMKRFDTVIIIGGGKASNEQDISRAQDLWENS